MIAQPPFQPSEPRYHILADGVARGPFKIAMIEALVMSGNLPIDPRICPEGEETWSFLSAFSSTPSTLVFTESTQKSIPLWPAIGGLVVLAILIGCFGKLRGSADPEPPVPPARDYSREAIVPGRYGKWSSHSMREVHFSDLPSLYPSAKSRANPDDLRLLIERRDQLVEQRHAIRREKAPLDARLSELWELSRKKRGDMSEKAILLELHRLHQIEAENQKQTDLLDRNIESIDSLINSANPPAR